MISHCNINRLFNLSNVWIQISNHGNVHILNAYHNLPTLNPKPELESSQRKYIMCNGNSRSSQKTGRNLQSRNNFDTRIV